MERELPLTLLPVDDDERVALLRTRQLIVYYSARAAVKQLFAIDAFFVALMLFCILCKQRIRIYIVIFILLIIIYYYII